MWIFTGAMMDGYWKYLYKNVLNIIYDQYNNTYIDSDQIILGDD